MKSWSLNRRTLLKAGTAASVVAVAPHVVAQSWPSKPVRIVCSYAPGGSSDIVARILAQQLSTMLGQSFIVENKPGAGGTLSALFVKAAPADGQTLMLSNLGPFSLAPTQFRNLKYDAVKDFTHAAYIGSEPTALFVAPSLGVSTLAEFVALARAQPKLISYGSSGSGSPAHINGEYFKSLAKIEMLHVPYKGAAPMITDFKGGVINAYITSLVLNMPSVEAGETRAIGSLGRARVAGAKDVKTFREQGYDIVSENWFGLSGPAGMSSAIVTALDAAVKEALRVPAIQDRLVKLGIDTAPRSTAEFNRFVADEIDTFRPRVLAVGVFEN